MNSSVNVILCQQHQFSNEQIYQAIHATTKKEPYSMKYTKAGTKRKNTGYNKEEIYTIFRITQTFYAEYNKSHYSELQKRIDRVINYKRNNINTIKNKFEKIWVYLIKPDSTDKIDEEQKRPIKRKTVEIEDQANKRKKIEEQNTSNLELENCFTKQIEVDDNYNDSNFKETKEQKKSNLELENCFTNQIEVDDSNNNIENISFNFDDDLNLIGNINKDSLSIDLQMPEKDKGFNIFDNV